MGPVRRNAVLFVAVSVVSGFGGNAMLLVTGIWLLDLTRSSSLAALAGLCVYAPQLAGPWLGGLLDRVPRRRLVIGVDLALAAALLGLVGVHRVWFIFAVSLAYGVSHVLRDAGETALLPSALSPAHLARVNGWRSSAQEGMKLVAPLAGTGLYGWAGGPAVAAASAATLVLAAGLYAALRLERMPTAVRERGLRAGLAVLRARRTVRVTTALAAVAITVSGFQTAASYAVVTTTLHLPATFLGLIGTAQGAGSVVGGVLAGRFIAARGTVAVGTAGTVVFAAAGLLRCLPWWPVTLATGLLTGIGLPWTLIAAVTAVQLEAPGELLGRVAATANTVMFGPIALAIPLGSVAVRLGSWPPLVAGAAACLLAAVVSRRPAPGVPGSRAASQTGPGRPVPDRS
jgi:Major Facilitator Superfamily